MTYSITYCKNNETVTIEWISPTDWSQSTVRECFERRFPQAEIISLEALL